MNLGAELALMCLAITLCGAPIQTDSTSATAPDSTAISRPDSSTMRWAIRPGGTIEVVVTGVRKDQGGALVVALYRGREGWLKIERAFARQVVPVTADSAMAAFTGMPFDSTYAVAVIHDRNGNGKMDMRIFPYPRPKEGVGVSGNTYRKGPPEYEKARFALHAIAVTLRVRLRY